MESERVVAFRFDNGFDVYLKGDVIDGVCTVKWVSLDGNRFILTSNDAIIRILNYIQNWESKI